MSSTALQHLTLGGRIPYEVILCDGCKKITPSKRCSRCQVAFYCSSGCQKKHWVREHRSDCLSLNEYREKVQNQPVPSVDSKSVAARNTDCSICLQDPISNPVVLPDCRHAFCGPCLVEWNSRSKRNYFQPQEKAPVAASPCPLCRTEAKDPQEQTRARAALLFGRARHQSCTPDERRGYLEAALQESDKFMDNTEVLSMQLMLTRVHILTELERGQDALDELREMARINAARVQALEPLEQLWMKAQVAEMQGGSDLAEIQAEAVARASSVPAYLYSRIPKYDMQSLAYLKVREAQALKLMGKWGSTWNTYRELVLNLRAFGRATHENPSDFRLSSDLLVDIWLGAAEAAYHIADYERGITCTDTALELPGKKYHPGIYKWKALSQKDMGQLDEAIKTMKIAALYETPWDDENRARVIELHNNLVDEKLAKERESNEK